MCLKGGFISGPNMSFFGILPGKFCDIELKDSNIPHFTWIFSILKVNFTSSSADIEIQIFKLPPKIFLLL